MYAKRGKNGGYFPQCDNRWNDKLCPKMGRKYEKRYLKHFENPDIIRYNYEHEELLMCYPELWTEEIRRIVMEGLVQDGVNIYE